MISWDISNIIDISVCIQLGCSDNNYQFRQMWNVATPCKASFQTKVKVTKVTIQTNMNCKFRQVSMTDSDKSQLSIQTNINDQFRQIWNAAPPCKDNFPKRQLESTGRGSQGWSHF